MGAPVPVAAKQGGDNDRRQSNPGPARANPVGRAWFVKHNLGDRVALHHHYVFLLMHQPHVLRKLVSPAWDGRDIAVFSGCFSQGLAQHKNVLGEVGLLNKAVGP